jgi:hypothetical protein
MNITDVSVNLLNTQAINHPNKIRNSAPISFGTCKPNKNLIARSLQTKQL